MSKKLEQVAELIREAEAALGGISVRGERKNEILDEVLFDLQGALERLSELT